MPSHRANTPVVLPVVKEKYKVLMVPYHPVVLKRRMGPAAPKTTGVTGSLANLRGRGGREGGKE